MATAAARKRRVALGFAVRTGRAVIVALGESLQAPVVMAKTRIDVATTFEEGAVFHTAQRLSLEKARLLVRTSEATFVARARVQLAAFVSKLEATVVAAGMAAGPPKTLPPIETILKAHPMLHAAEGELYRRVFAEAAATLRVPLARVPVDALSARAAAELEMGSAELAARLAAMGKASGRPWAADQKNAALAAWLAWALSPRERPARSRRRAAR